MNHFELLGLPLSFFPDPRTTRNSFLRLSREYHPDLQSDKSDESVSEQLKKSSILNEAYRTLSSFEATVAYILGLKGFLNEGDKASLSPAFLMEMMEVNESLMDAKMAGDEKAMASCRIEIENREQELMENWSALCRQYDASQNASLLPAIRDCYFQHRYLFRLKEQLT